MYHEYTHGLSNRLVIYPDGESALGAGQSYAMGEAWSDWYGLDLLMREGSIIDTPAVDVVEGRFVTGGPGIRFQAADCDVDSAAVDCPAPKGGAGPGGYTYGDYGHVFRGPNHTRTARSGCRRCGTFAKPGLEHHGDAGHPRDGALTLRTRPIWTCGTRSSMQTSSRSRGVHVDDIWTVFAGRGMGFFAESLGGDDESPTQDFSMPPTCPGDVTCGRIEGTVKDRRAGVRSGRSVRVSGGASGIPLELSTTTEADGSFLVEDVPYHTYRLRDRVGPGFDVRRSTT